MVKYILMISFLFMLPSCSEQKSIAEPSFLSTHSSNLIEKSGEFSFYLEKVERLHSIEASQYSFVGVNEWLDENTILYLTDENGESIVNKFNIFTGDNEVFFKIPEPIIRVDANFDHSIFLIEVATTIGESDLYFVNKKGEEIYKISNIGIDYKIYWNSFIEGYLLVAALQSDFSMKLYEVDLNLKRKKAFDFEHFYIQWINEKEFAYLKWDMYVPGYYAPLYVYNIENGLERNFSDDVIAFFSFNNYLLTVSVEGRTARYSNYSFFDTKTKEKVASLNVPILYTYSEQWWVPNHQFDRKNNRFIYFEPKKTSDLFQYSEGYNLVSFSINSSKREEIIKSDENYPMKLSPDGRWLLYGYQLEKLVDLKKKEINSLLYW